MKINGYEVDDVLDQAFYSYMKQKCPSVLPNTRDWANYKIVFRAGGQAIVHMLGAVINKGQSEQEVAGQIMMPSKVALKEFE